MFTKARPTDPQLDEAIRRIYLDLTRYNSHSTEYSTLVKQLSKLYKLREETSKKRVSPDTLALVLGNLAGVLLIVSYEKHNIVTSKALTFVQKLR